MAVKNEFVLTFDDAPPGAPRRVVRVPAPPESVVLGRVPALAIADRLVSREHVRVSIDSTNTDSSGVSVTQLGLRASLVNGALLPRLASTRLALGQTIVLVPPAKFAFTLRRASDVPGHTDDHNDDVDNKIEPDDLADERVTTGPTTTTVPLSVSVPPPPVAGPVRRSLTAFEAEVLHFASSLLGGDDRGDEDEQRLLSDRERQWLVTAAAMLRRNLGALLLAESDEMRVCQAFVRALLTGNSGVADLVLDSDAWFWYAAQADLRQRRAADALAASREPASRAFSRTLGDEAADAADDASDSDAAAADKELLANVSALDDVALGERRTAAQIDRVWMAQARKRQSASLQPLAPPAAPARALAPSAELEAADQTTQHNDAVAADEPHTADSLAAGGVSDYALVASERGQSRHLPVSARIANVDELRMIGSCHSTLLGLWTLGDINKRDEGDGGGGEGDDAPGEAAVFLPLRPYILVARVETRANGIALVDSRGFVMASFVAPPLAIDGAVLLVTDWRCVHWRGRCYVEVAPRGYTMLAPASDVDDAASLLRGTHTTMAALTALGDAGDVGDVALRALQTAERGAKDAPTRRFAFRARIRALSPAVLMVPSDQTTVHFFAHVVGADGASTAVLFMGERALLMRHYMHVGAVHTFSHLQVRRMFRGTARERFVMASTDDTLLLSCEWPSVPVASALPPLCVPSAAAATAHVHVSQCITYRGRISALLGRGVVELDGAVSLLLAHCQLLDQGLGMRVGALVVAHNVHVVESRERLRALGVCALSHVAVVRHSPLNAPFVPPCRKSSPALYLQPQQRVGFARFLWLFDAQRALSRKFPRHACTDAVLWGDAELSERGALARLLDAVRAPQFERQMYTEFLDHDRACWLGERLDARGAPLLLDVRSVFATDAVRGARRAALLEARFVAQQLSRWRAVRPAAGTTALVRERSADALVKTVAGVRDALLVAQLVFSDDDDDDDGAGPQLRLCDATGDIDLLAVQRSVSIRDIGQIFLFPRYAVVVEGVPQRALASLDAGTTPRTPKLTPGAASGAAIGDAVRMALLVDEPATLVVGDLVDPALMAPPPPSHATPDDAPVAGARNVAVRGRSRLQAVRARRRTFLAAVLGSARVAARGESPTCVMCVVHSVVAAGASAFDAQVSIQLATRVQRATLRFAGKAARWRHVVTPESCVVVSAIAGERVVDDAFVFAVAFDEAAAASGDGRLLARWNLAYGLGGERADALIAASDSVVAEGAAGDIVLALLDPRLPACRAAPHSLRAVLALAAHETPPAAVSARIHERQWLLNDGDARPWLRLELRDVAGPDFCAAWLPAEALGVGALVPGGVVHVRGAKRTAAHDSVRLTGDAARVVLAAAAAPVRERGAAQVIVDNGELFRAYLADVETRPIATFRAGGGGRVRAAMTPRSSVAVAAERAAVYRVVATLASVTSARVVWQCRRCGRAIPNQCRPDCSWPDFALRVVAVALIDDGTAPAVVRALDEFAAQLLRLDGDDVRVLRMACYTHGAVEWSGFKRHAAVNAMANSAWLDDAQLATGDDADAADAADDAAALLATAAADAPDGRRPRQHPALALLTRRATAASSSLARLVVFCRQLQAPAGTFAGGGGREVQLFAHRVEPVDVHGEARQLLEAIARHEAGEGNDDEEEGDATAMM